jgi:hypothetical protein
MKISEFKNALSKSENLTFKNVNGEIIPPHFHITEVGLSTKHFIDCGKSIHIDKKANFQIWVANDVEHRLEPSKLLNIIERSEYLLGGEDLDVEFEYQTETVGKYALGYENGDFYLLATQTDCLAKSECGIEAPIEKMRDLGNLVVSSNACCTPGGGCC